MTTLREARQHYFDANKFGDDGGYTARWVTLKKIGPVALGFPNWPGRIRAVRFHDLHHVLTGYHTDFIGEAEIGAWELASGCAHHLAAWWLNGGAMATGLLLSPSRVYRAFIRGRHSRNLYRAEYDDALLARSVSEVRRELHLDSDHVEATALDKAWFTAFAVSTMTSSLVGTLAMIAAPTAFVVWLVRGS